MKQRIIYLAAALFVLLAGAAIAQENDGTPPAQVGTYRFGGNVTAGFRTTTVNTVDGRLTSQTWAERLFHEQYQYDPTKGLPVIDLNLYGEKPLGGEGFFDNMFLNASYDGANAIGSLRLREFGSYDFKVSYTHSNYFFDRYDSIFSDLRQFDQTRDRMSASLTVTPVEMLDINVQYFGTGRSGNQEIPRSPFLELGGEPLGTGGYARGNIFLMDVPMNDWTNRFQASLTARLPMTSVTAGGGFRSFSQDADQTPALLTSLNLVGDSVNGYVNEFGIIGTSKVKSPLTSFDWKEHRESSGPFAFGQVVFKPIDMLSATATVNYQKVEGSATVDALQAGLMYINSNGSKLGDYRATWEGESNENSDMLNAGLTLSFRPIDGLQVLGGFEYQKSTSSADGVYHSTIDTLIKGTEIPSYARVRADSIVPFDVVTDYDIPVSTILGEVLYSPIRELTLRGGVRMAMRTPVVTRHLDEELDSAYSADMSEKTTTTTLTFNAAYRPIQEVRIGARVENMTRTVDLDNPTSLLKRNDLDNPTATPRRSPLKDLAFSGSIDADVIEGLTISLSGGAHSGDNEIALLSGITTSNLTPKLEQDGKSLTGSLTYQLPANSQISFTADYSENNFSIPATWTRGTLVANPPFGTNTNLDSMTVLITENTIDRYYGIQASTSPISDLTVTAGFNYIRSTGGSWMTPGIPATATNPTPAGDVSKMNGPYTRWEARGQVQYFFLPNLGLAVNGLFASQEEDLTGFYVALNNFKATQLTFSLMARL